MYKWYHDICLSLTSLSMIISMSIHIATNGIISFFFMTEQYSIVYICIYVCVCAVVVQLLSFVWFFVTPWTVTHQAPLFLGFPGKNTGVGCHFLLQGIFPTQRSNPHLLCLPHWQMGSLPLVPPREPLPFNDLSIFLGTLARYLSLLISAAWLRHCRDPWLDPGFLRVVQSSVDSVRVGGILPRIATTKIKSQV